MKSVSKIVQLMLLCTTIFTGQNIITAPPKPQDKIQSLEPVYETQEEIKKRENLQKQGIARLPQAPQKKASLYPSVNTTTPSSTVHTTSQKIARKRPSSSQTNKALTREELSHLNTAAELIQTIWSLYVLVVQQDSEGFDENEWKELTTDLKKLNNTISSLKNAELTKLYEPINKVFNSEDVWNIEIVAIHLYNLITAINNFANTKYDLTDIAQYLTIESEENPFYGAYNQAVESGYGLLSPITSAWSSAKQAASSSWDYAKQGVQYIKSFVGQPSKEEFDLATARLAKIKELENKNNLNKTDQDLLNRYKINEAQDRAMVAKWWPYLVTVAGAGAFYYMFPEFSKNVAGYGASAAGYVAKPALKAATVYGGYKLWTSEPTSKKKVKTIAKPTQAPMKKTN